MRVACMITLTDEERTALEKYARGRSTPVRLMQRARIVLLASEGMENKEIAVKVGLSRQRVGGWRKRFVEQRIAGIEKDAPHGGRKPAQRAQQAARIIAATTQTRPDNATHWSTRTLAAHLGTNRSMVHRVWQAVGLKPHLTKTFKLSNDPHFMEKVVDVTGLYLNPPEHALVLCLDEKSQIQALDRTQPGLPIKNGRCGTMTHDYKRNGTTTLFAAFNAASGEVIGACKPRHRHQEWIQFLRQIDAETPADLDLHLIADNYATHKHPLVKAWLKRHPRFHLHFTPTSSSWLNLVERWLRELTDKRIRRGVFRCVGELVQTIMDYIDKHNAHAQPFVWTATAHDIQQKVQRARNVLNKLTSA